MTNLQENLTAVFPIQGLDELRELVFVRPDEEVPSLLIFRLVTWEGDHQRGVRYIKDVVEQGVYLPTNLPDHLATHGGRNANFCEALRCVLVDILGKPVDGTLYPADLLIFGPLGKPSFGTVDDFEQSLRRKSNLGRFL